MNRRSFFAAILATPAAAALPPVPAVRPVLIGPGKSIAAREVIRRAFITMGALGPGQCLSSADADYGLVLLEEMVARFKWDSLLPLRQDTRIPLLYCKAMREILAAALAPSYGAAATALPTNKPEPLLMQPGWGCGRCSMTMLAHGHGMETYFTCGWQECPQYQVPVKAPVMVCAPADPEVVRRTEKQEQEDLEYRLAARRSGSV